MRHVMVATDGSSGANRAIDVAAELAKAVAGDLLIATVADSQLERRRGSWRVSREVLAMYWKR